MVTDGKIFIIFWTGGTLELMRLSLLPFSRGILIISHQLITQKLLKNTHYF